MGGLCLVESRLLAGQKWSRLSRRCVHTVHMVAVFSVREWNSGCWYNLRRLPRWYGQCRPLVRDPWSYHGRYRLEAWDMDHGMHVKDPVEILGQRWHAVL